MADKAEERAVKGLKDIEKVLGVGFFAGLARACGNEDAARSHEKSIGKAPSPKKPPKGNAHG